MAERPEFIDPSAQPPSHEPWAMSGGTPTHAPAGDVPSQPRAASAQPSMGAVPPQPGPAPSFAAVPPPNVPAPDSSPQQDSQRPPIAPRRRQTGSANSGRVVLAATVVSLIVGSAAGFGSALVGHQLFETQAGQVQESGQPSSPSSEPATPTAAQDAKPQSTERIAAKLLPSTVTISVRSGSSSSSGSGFVMDNAGRVLTNNHVVAGAENGSIVVQFSDGTRHQASIVGRSPSYDLAVILVSDAKNLRPVDMGDSSKLRPGQTAIAVGAPLGLGGSVTEGIISAINRPVSVRGGDSSAADRATAYINGVQTDAPINPGNSGGPLVNSAGQVIAVNSAILTTNTNEDQQGGSIGLGFAIPMNQAKIIAKELIDDGQAKYPIIGAEVGDTDGQVGVSVRTVAPGSPASKAGLQVGDVIDKVNDRAVSSATELIVALRTYRPGDTVTMSVRRGETPRTVKVTLGGRVG